MLHAVVHIKHVDDPTVSVSLVLRLESDVDALRDVPEVLVLLAGAKAPVVDSEVLTA